MTIRYLCGALVLFVSLGAGPCVPTPPAPPIPPLPGPAPVVVSHDGLGTAAALITWAVVATPTQTPVPVPDIPVPDDTGSPAADAAPASQAAAVSPPAAPATVFAQQGSCSSGSCSTGATFRLFRRR